MPRLVMIQSLSSLLANVAAPAAPVAPAPSEAPSGAPIGAAAEEAIRPVREPDSATFSPEALEMLKASQAQESG